jgi:manganese transport protein
MDAFSNSYKQLEKWIIGFVSIIGISFIFELSIVHINWNYTVKNLAIINFPNKSMLTIMSVLGAVIMPHNLFLHSEIIQSRKWNTKDSEIIKSQLKYEFVDTLVSMVIGWAINCAMIILAACTFFTKHLEVNDLTQAKLLLEPLLGKGAALIFGIGLLFAGISSTMTAGMAGGSIFAGIFRKPYNIKDVHTKVGIVGILFLSSIIIFMISDPFKALIYSQMFLSIQLPFTVFLQIYLTSSNKIMGEYKNSVLTKVMLWIIGIFVTVLNIMLFISYI